MRHNTPSNCCFVQFEIPGVNNINVQNNETARIEYTYDSVVLLNSYCFRTWRHFNAFVFFIEQKSCAGFYLKNLCSIYSKMNRKNGKYIYKSTRKVIFFYFLKNSLLHISRKKVHLIKIVLLLSILWVRNFSNMNIFYSYWKDIIPRGARACTVLENYQRQFSPRCSNYGMVCNYAFNFNSRRNNWIFIKFYEKKSLIVRTTSMCALHFNQCAHIWRRSTPTTNLYHVKRISVFDVTEKGL